MRREAQDLPLVGIDVGGTFTDFVLLVDGELEIFKAPTTPDDQSRAIVAGLAELGVSVADIVHGMTVATNALLERRGARTALLTTAGFADVLVIGRQNRPEIYALQQARPPLLVEDDWRLEAPERLDHVGRELLPLDEEAVRAAAEQLRHGEAESLAIVFLFSFRNPAHERRAAELVHDVMPDLPISLSSTILPEYREYERTATTVINAYVQPLVARYLKRLDEALAGSRVRIMQSNGGAIGLHQAADEAARLVLSGPAGGVVGAFALAGQSMDNDAPRIITFDMGGTSTDVALCPGIIPTTAESTITGLPLRLPVIDIHTVGAGGGSIAYVDAGGALHVGPRSAGAVPGPACYGRGGTEPTVTDANLVLGRLTPGGFLGGKGSVTLDEAASRRVLTNLGAEMRLTPEAAALGVVRVANATMERALRRVSVERGYDPRDFVLVPFGGAGPLHTCELADSLAIPRVLVPPMPGVLSAYGMLVADIAHDASQAVLADVETLQAAPAELIAQVEMMATRVRNVLRADGIDVPLLEAALDMRYRGQSYELTIPLALPVERGTLAAAVHAFHSAHEQRYGYAIPGEPVEAVTLRVRGHGAGTRPELPRQSLGSADATSARVGRQPAWFSEGGPDQTDFYDRDRLRAGNRFAGPAVVLQFDSTLVVPPGWTARVDERNSIWLER
jgi:N-methylhydantoinase A